MARIAMRIALQICYTTAHALLLPLLSSFRPPIVLAKGSDVPLTAGAPLAFFAPQLPGYTRLPGRLPFDYGSYDCPESEM